MKLTIDDLRKIDPQASRTLAELRSGYCPLCCEHARELRPIDWAGITLMMCPVESDTGGAGRGHGVWNIVENDPASLNPYFQWWQSVAAIGTSPKQFGPRRYGSDPWPAAQEPAG